MGNPADLFSLAGQVALVTGAGSGLGRQFTEVMAEAGADVACADIDAESAQAAAAAVAGLGRRGVAIGCDVTVETEVEAMVARTVEVLGRLDILFNNAGIADPQALLLPSRWAGSPRPPRSKARRSSSPQPPPTT